MWQYSTMYVVCNQCQKKHSNHKLDVARANTITSWYTACVAVVIEVLLQTYFCLPAQISLKKLQYQHHQLKLKIVEQQDETTTAKKMDLHLSKT